jgi:hypothetical protein
MFPHQLALPEELAPRDLLEPIGSAQLHRLHLQLVSSAWGCLLPWLHAGLQSVQPLLLPWPCQPAGWSCQGCLHGYLLQPAADALLPACPPHGAPRVLPARACPAAAVAVPARLSQRAGSAPAPACRHLHSQLCLCHLPRLVTALLLVAGQAIAVVAATVPSHHGGVAQVDEADAPHGCCHGHTLH